MKKIISLLLSAAMLIALSACGKDAKNADGSEISSGNSKPESVSTANISQDLDTKCNIFGLNGPTGIGLAPLMKKASEKKGLLDYSITNVGSNDEIVAKLVNGEADIAAVATNLASTLYKKTNGGIKVLAVNTLGVLTLVSKGEEISSIADLKGKTVYSTGKGANPEYIINYILEKSGLVPGKDVTLEFVSQPTEIVSLFATNEKITAIAPQPVATVITVQDKDAKIVLDMNSEWEKSSDTKLVMGCLVARKEFIESKPDAVKAFMRDYEESVKTVNSDPDTAAALCEEYGIVAKAAIAKKALPYCNIVFEDGKQMKTDLSAYLNFLYEKNPASIGGELPDNDFYYNAK